MLWLPLFAKVKASADAAVAAVGACLTKANNLSDLSSVATARTNLGLGALATVSNLTGPITSAGAATAVAAQTGTGSVFAMSASPTFTGTVSMAAAILSGALTVGGLLDISGASAGQIKFPATQNASAGANTLDDYEEGTFTPTLRFGALSTGITYTTQIGKYTKVGRLVFWMVRVLLSSKGSATGTADMSGMPFNTAAGDLYPYTTSFISGLGAISNANGYVSGGSISLLKMSAGNSSNQADTDWVNTTQIIMDGCYETT
jgi:hypothetical protein